VTRKQVGLGLLGVLAVPVLLCAGNVAREVNSKPELAPSDLADAQVGRMWDALNEPAWQATFTFDPGGRTHLWDRQRAFDRVTVGDSVTLVNLDDQSGRAFEAGVELFGADRDAALQDAYAMWINERSRADSRSPTRAAGSPPATPTATSSTTMEPRASGACGSR
jgi:hypothetical protein